MAFRLIDEIGLYDSVLDQDTWDTLSIYLLCHLVKKLEA